MHLSDDASRTFKKQRCFTGSLFLVSLQHTNNQENHAPAAKLVSWGYGLREDIDL